MKYLLLLSVFLMPTIGIGQSKTPESILIDSMTPEVHSLLTTGWTISVLDEIAWRDAVRKLGPDTTTAFTDLREHHTFIRREFLETGEPRLIRFVLAHEAGHIACKCNSEKIASDFAHRQL